MEITFYVIRNNIWLYKNQNIMENKSIKYVGNINV
jgi:hypothetical protein